MNFRVVSTLAGIALAVLILTPSVPAAEDAERITLDWVFSDEGKSAASVPDHAWFESGHGLLYDKHPEMAQRTLESLDPSTGARRKLVDSEKSLKLLNEMFKPEEPYEELGWPSALDPQGGYAAYVKEDDLMLLDLGSGEWSRITETDDVVKSPRFSPDGKWLAYVRGNDLSVREIETGEEKRLTEDGTETLLNGTVSWVYWEEIFGRSDQGYQWSPDSKSIAYLQTDESGVGLMTFVDFEPNVPKVIHQRYPKTGEANPRVRAGVVALETGKTAWVDLGAYPYEYLARVNWLPDGKRLAVQTLDRQQTKLDLFLADAATGEVSHVMRETDPGWINLHDDLYFLEKQDRFVWASERDGFAHLYLYEMDGTLVRRITDGEWALSASGGVFWARQAVSHIDEEGGWVYFTALEKSSIEKQLYRVRLDGTGFERISQGDGTHRILFRTDGAYYLDDYSAIDRMPSLELHESDGSGMRTLAEPRPDLVERFELLPRELFSVSARDGFPMPAMMLKPRDFDPNKKYPVVIYVYGGPSAPTIAHAWSGSAEDYYEQILADRGYIVFRVDNRSATAISKQLENTILHAGYGDAELNDLLDGVKWLKSQPYVDPERVGIWGWSGGGSFTLLALTKTREFRAGVAVAAVTDWAYYDTKWAEAYMKRPQDNPEGYASTSHAARAKELHGRLLLVHGTYDDNVHPQNAWRFADELIDANIMFDMMIYPMRKHGIEDDEAQQHLYSTMLEFWDRNMQGVRQ
jgi:dipeptidyl-peptidase-4